MMRGVRCLLPVVLLATGACFATREDVQALHADVQSLRAQNARSDSANVAALQRVVASLTVVHDSLGMLSARVVKMQGDVRGDLYNVGQQLLQIQELTGQSQQRVQELRASLEQRQSDIQSSTQPAPAPSGATSPAGAPSGAGAPPPAGAGATPGPNQLFQISLEQLRRGSPGAARTGLLRFSNSIRPPTSSRTPSSISARPIIRRGMRPVRIPRTRRSSPAIRRLRARRRHSTSVRSAWRRRATSSVRAGC